MKRKGLIGALALISGLALGAACEQRPGQGSNERGGSTSLPTSRGPSGGATSSPGSTGSGGTASGSASSPSSSDQSGTGGSGDAGMGGRDGGMR